MNLLDARGACLVFRNLRCRIERWISQLIYSKLFTPMIGNEDRVWANRAHDERRKNTFAAPGDYAHPLSIVDLEFRRSLRMNLNVGFGTLLDQKADASRLIAGKILIDDTPTGENQWVLFVRNL